MGAKRLGLKIEAKRLGGKQLGGNVLGTKRRVTFVNNLILDLSMEEEDASGWALQIDRKKKKNKNYIFLLIKIIVLFA